MSFWAEWCFFRGSGRLEGQSWIAVRLNGFVNGVEEMKILVELLVKREKYKVGLEPQATL